MKIKKTNARSILTILFFGINLIVYSQNGFSNGYKQGFPIGYCYYAGMGCIPPITPIVPMPSIGESSSSYNDGYNRGLLDGINKFNDDKRSNSYSNSSKSLNPYSTPQIIPEYKPFKPDFEFYQRAMTQKQSQTNSYSNSNQSQAQKDAELQRFIDNYYSPENIALRNQYIKLTKSLYSNLTYYPNSLPNGVYGATIISEPPPGQEKPYASLEENCTVVVQDNKIISIISNNIISGKTEVIYFKPYFPTLVLEYLDDYIEQSFPIEKGKGSYKWTAYNGYKIGLGSQVFQVYFNEYLTDYNSAQKTLVQLKNKYKSKTSFPKVANGWHTAYLTNNLETCAIRNVYVENGKVIKWIGRNGDQNMVDTGGQIVNCKTTVSIIWPPALNESFYSSTFLVKPKTEIFDIYFIDL